MTTATTMPMLEDKPLLLIMDGHALVHRAWHAIREPLNVRSTGEEVRAMLLSAASGQFTRGMVMSDILKNMGATAPAFGMIGTLIGLIVMLGTLGGEGGAEALGAGLSVALMTTLYGVLVARIVFIPASSKTAQRESIMRFRNFLITEGFVLLAESKRPRYIQDKMNSYLDPKIHYSIEKSGGGGGKAKKAA